MVDELVTKPIPGLIRKIAVPASVGFFFQTMFNVVDTYYAGLLSTEAIAALSLSFPIFFIIIAMGAGIGQGSTALISNALGAKKKDKARTYAAQAISFGVLLSVVLTVLGLVSAPHLFRFLGAQESYLATSLAYINVVYYGTVFFLLNNILNSILIAIGDTKKFRNFLIVGFFLNLVLDPWFMFGGFGLPAMGISGIALATVVIQIVGVIYMFSEVLKTGLLTKDTLHHLKPEKQPFKDISKQGFPASINMMTVAIGIFVITWFISKFGQEAVAAYGIATRVEQIALLPTIGLNMATLTLVGQNNGAKKYARVKEAWQTAIKYGFYILTVGAIGVFFFTEQLMGLFTKDPAVIPIGAFYLKIAVFVFYAYTILFITVAALQGLKKPMYGLWMGIFRQIVGPLIVFSILIKFYGLHGVWYGVVIVTWAAALITFFYARHLMKKIGCFE